MEINEIKLNNDWLKDNNNKEEEDNNNNKDYNNLIFNLLGNENDWFINQYWEKKPCLFQHNNNNNNNSRDNNNNNSILNSIFSKNILLSLCNNNQLSLLYSNNMNVVKYISNKRITHDDFINNKNNNNYITKNSIKSYFNDGYTIQFFQPQRFNDNLYKFCAAFEEYFGTLAGASAYLTPPNTQGLAPHWDDVEVFILQTEGSKQWNLWKPNHIQLPDTYSNDIQRETLSSTPDAQFILNTGDILYFPRGTIHEAIALDNFSTHITISVYQKYHNKLLIERILPSLIEKYFDKQPSDISIIPDIRKGLPINVFSKLGSHISSCLQLQSKLDNQQSENNELNQSTQLYNSIINYRQNFKSQMKSILNDMIETLDEEDIDEGIDLIGDDFCQNRLPDPKETILNNQNYHIIKDNLEIDKQIFLKNYKSSHKFIENMTLLKKLKKYSEIYFKISPPSWFHLRRQIVDGVHLLLIGTGKNNNRLNHMGHQIDEQESNENNIDNNDENDENNENNENDENDSNDELEQADDMDPEFSWVKLTLPIRFHKLISLFHVLSIKKKINWISFEEYTKNLKLCDKSFIEDEIFELIFGLHNINLLEIAISSEVKDIMKSKRKISNNNESNSVDQQYNKP